MVVMSEDAKFNNLCAHYKDTLDLHQTTVKSRDRLFYILLPLLALFTLELSDPKTATGLAAQFFKKLTGADLGTNVYFIATLLWFSLLGLSFRYFQTVAEIERQYVYVYGLEKELNAHYGSSVAFTREGKSYEKNFASSGFHVWAWVLYTILFPLLFLVITTARIVAEAKALLVGKVDLEAGSTARILWKAMALTHEHSLNFWLDFTCAAVIAVTTVLYVLLLHAAELARAWRFVCHHK